jgi:membrane glycosyltransferase
MLQANTAERNMFARRVIFAVLFLVTMAGSLWLAALALTPGGFGILDLAALFLFAVTLPWMVAGFCNAVIGFIIMRFSADPVTSVLPAAGLIRDDEPVTASTAVLLCVRNELPLRIIRNLEPMLEGIHASGYGERFHLYLLSDTNDADLAVREEALFPS